MFNKTYRDTGILISILFLILLLLSCDFLNKDDEKETVIPGGGSGYSYTLTDSSLDAPAGRFLTRVYSGPSRTFSSSLSGSGSLANGNSVTVTGLTSEGVPYLIFIWVDEDGDGVYGDDYRGALNTIDTISADVEIEMSGTLGTLDFKPVTISIDSAMTKYLRCYWLLGGTLDDTAKNLLGSWSDSDDPDTLVGRYAFNTTVTTPTYDITAGHIIPEFWPVINLPFPPSGFNYDCYCFIDVDGDTTRNSGDYEGSAVNVEADNSTVNITMTGI